jgi:ferredoxin
MDDDDVENNAIPQQRPNKKNTDNDDDWQRMLQTKQDGSFWSSFEPSNDESDKEEDSKADEESSSSSKTNSKKKKGGLSEEEESEAWLDVVAMLSAEEVEFNQKDAQRADLARQMQEWQFDAETIASTLGVAMDTRLESIDEVAGMQAYREEAFLDQVDLETVESHTQVDMDEDTGEPYRQQMVYVDEHTCIGCTNCASIAQSTFFMHSEHGRARVFQQWGDDDETIQIAIETCPVDCIHYIPYDELVALEKERRFQNINPKGRLVSQAENGNSLSHFGGGAVRFTAPQVISGNSKPRCANCPTRGCQDCPMFGVGKNPEFERKERLRLERRERRKLQEQRESQQKRADL